MNRGSSIIALPRSGEDRGFNEAPIHESGKSGRLKVRPGVSWRFNEAPIHESGKSPTPADSPATVAALQ